MCILGELDDFGTMFLYIILAGASLLALYHWLNSSFNVWKSQNVPHPPVNLLFGNVKDVILLKKSLGQVYEEVYNAYENLLYVGFYRNRTPSIVLRDPEIIKTVLAKDFNSFHDNDMEVDEKIDPMFARNPFSLKGDKWKVGRAQAISCLTSGKMKSLHPIMVDVAKKFVDYIQREQEMLGKDSLDAKETCAKFTTENVINCSFGIEANCFNNPNSEFREMGKRITSPTFCNGVQMMLAFAIPACARLFHIKIVPNIVANFFRKLVKDVLQYRSTNNIKRNDFLDNLLEIRAKNDKFDNEDIAAHCVGLFIDGFETSSIAMSFVFYELAANPACQDKLKKEIDDVLEKGEVTYEAIQNMTYLDTVISESLRLHPPAPFIMRKCTQAFKLPSPDGSSNSTVDIAKGTIMMVPINALHMDEKHFEKSEEFKPERFLEENKSEITKFTYIPFGEGPRICLGQRFGIHQIKVAIFYVVANFEMRVNKKTIQPIQVDPHYFLTAAKGGLWLNFYKRNK